MLKRLIIILVLFAVIACSSSKTAVKPVPGSENEQQEKLTAEKLRSGYNLFVENCGGCHFLPVPSSKSKVEWDKLLPEMFTKTQLDENQQQLIKLYIYSKL
jgi:cytochrome c5